MTTLVERELKFDAGADFAVPDVRDLLPEGGTLAERTLHLDSEYFDTADHALLRAGITLRHRAGGEDGWQLKVPHEPFRLEIQLPDEPDSEQQMHRWLFGVTRGQALRRVARIRTERHTTGLLDGDGQPLAEIDDDHVHASAGGTTAMATAWREVEIELSDDDPRLMAALRRALRRAGARPSKAPGKLHRALGEQPGRSPRARRARDVLGAYVEEQRRVILAGDVRLRRGDESVIHKTRVASRRLRSCLRVFGDYVEAERATALDEELRWFAGLLGEVRDRQVLRERFAGRLEELDDTLRLGPVQRELDQALHAEQNAAWSHLMAELEGDRYLALLEQLELWSHRTPWTSRADEPASALRDGVRQARRKTVRRLRAAAASGDGEQLHRARKAAKRTRYAAELALPVLGKRRSKAVAGRYQDLQDLLGEHQDSLVAADVLRRLGAAAGVRSGENGFTYGVLLQRELDAAERAKKQARKVARSLT